MPQGPIQTIEVGAIPVNFAANTAGQQLKTGPGVLRRLTVNTAGVTSTASFYDGTSTAGKLLATVTTVAQVSMAFDFVFTTGLFVVLAGGTPANATVSYN